MFNNFSIEPSNEGEEESASFIIETGFHLFIIFCIFLEVKMENEDGRGGESMEESKEESLS